MGWDIFMYAEVLRQGRWRLITATEPVRSFDPRPPGEEPELKPVEIYKDRNSSLFAILAGIGNLGGGDSPFPCISPPRGVPADLSEELAAWYARNDGVTFAASWLLLDELLNFDWHGTRVLRRGIADPAIARAFRSASGGEPDAAWPPDTPYAYSDQELFGPGGPGIEVHWRESCAEAVGSRFLTGVLGDLQARGNPRDVRVVFWFDF